MKQKAMEESQQKPHVPQFPAPSPPVSESGFHSTASVIMEDEIEEEIDDKSQTKSNIHSLHFFRPTGATVDLEKRRKMTT